MAYTASFASRLGSSVMASKPGRQFAQGVGEMFGFEYKQGINMGLLGRKLPGGITRGGMIGTAGRLFMPAFLAYDAYSGFKEGGVFGAAKNVASSALSWGAIRAGFSMLANPITAVAAGVAAVGYGTYKLGEAAKMHSKRIRNLEMGADIVDRYGTMSTMRQRSLQALQNSHINGRMALGNEALLLSGG